MASGDPPKKLVIFTYNKARLTNVLKGLCEYPVAVQHISKVQQLLFVYPHSTVGKVKCITSE